MDKNKSGKVRRALNKFHINFKIQFFKTQLYKKLLATGININFQIKFNILLLQIGVGKMFKLFNCWKNLPERRNDAKYLKCNNFERKFAAFALRPLKLSFRRLAENRIKGDEFK
jgi:hypothetical protein